MEIERPMNCYPEQGTMFCTRKTRNIYSQIWKLQFYIERYFLNLTINNAKLKWLAERDVCSDYGITINVKYIVSNALKSSSLISRVFHVSYNILGCFPIKPNQKMSFIPEEVFPTEIELLVRSANLIPLEDVGYLRWSLIGGWYGWVWLKKPIWGLAIKMRVQL